MEKAMGRLKLKDWTIMNEVAEVDIATSSFIVRSCNVQSCNFSPPPQRNMSGQKQLSKRKGIRQ